MPKGEGALPALIAVAGKQAAVLLSRRAIGPSQRKMMAEQLGTSGGIKYYAGECLWEANAHTFVLEARVANLARLVAAALHGQTDTRFKVRVRGSDPDDVEADDEGLPGETIESEGPQEVSPQASTEQARYAQRLAELKDRIAAALQGLEALAAQLDKPAAIPAAHFDARNLGKRIAALHQALENHEDLARASPQAALDALNALRRAADGVTKSLGA